MTRHLYTNSHSKNGCEIYRMFLRKAGIKLSEYMAPWARRLLHDQCHVKVKVKQSPYRLGQVLRVPGGWDSLISGQSAYEDGKVVSPTTFNAPLHPFLRKYSWHPLLLEAESTPGSYCGRRIKWIENSTDTLGNRTRNLLVCSAVSQPTAPLRTHDGIYCPPPPFYLA